MADDLFCCERLHPEPPKSGRDPIIFNDHRVITNLLYLEKQSVPSCNYFTDVQRDIKPFMRQVVCTWMLEVCEEMNAEDQIFPLSVNLLDRFLATCCIYRRHIQLAASVCLLLASKIRQCHSISSPKLCYYTDHSITPNDLKDWELLVLSKLQWNLMAVTAHDFVEHIINRAGLDSEHPLLRQHTSTLVGVCYTDSGFIQVLPSVMAAACIASAARGLRTPSSATVLNSICEVLDGTTPAMVEPVICRIEEALEAESGISTAPSTFGIPAATPEKRNSLDRHPDTPTDISDIHF